MKKSKLPRQPRARKAGRKPAPQRMDPRPNARGVFRDGSKIITDLRGLMVGLVEARPKYIARRLKQSEA
jgi:hypothetical protein